MDDEELFLYTLREYLEAEDEVELSQLLRQANIVFKYSSEYSNKKWNQCSAYVEIKVPVSVRKKVEKEKQKLHDYCSDIYEDTDAYGFVGVKIGVTMPEKTSEEINKSKNNAINIHSKNQIYNNLITKTSQLNLEENEKMYI